jgi:hypothetical protein
MLREYFEPFKFPVAEPEEESLSVVAKMQNEWLGRGALRVKVRYPQLLKRRIGSLTCYFDKTSSSKALCSRRLTSGSVHVKKLERTKIFCRRYKQDPEITGVPDNVARGPCRKNLLTTSCSCDADDCLADNTRQM